MRVLKPNPRGIFKPTNQAVKSGRQVTVYSHPVKSVHKIDQLLKGEMPRLAITRKGGGIGDVLMTLPTVKALSKKYKVKLDYGTDFDYLYGALPKVLLHNPYIDSVLPWKSLDPDDYHAILDLTCPCVAHEVPMATPINRIDLFARHLGVALEDTDIDYYITDDERTWAKRYIYDHRLEPYKLLLVQPSSSTSRRDAPHDKVQRAVGLALANQIDLRTIVLTHSTDNGIASWNFGNIHRAHDLDVRQIAALMEQCEIVLCPDSSVLHLASALHKKTVTLFGPTDPRARVNYHPKAVAVWPGKELKGYPRWFEGETGGGEFLAWKRLDPDLVAYTLLSVLNNLPLPESRELVTFGTYNPTQKMYENI